MQGALTGSFGQFFPESTGGVEVNKDAKYILWQVLYR